MKRILSFSSILSILLLPLSLSSCNSKEQTSPEGEIIIRVADEMDAEVSHTKATEITSIPSSLYWGASTGTSGSETAKWSAAAVTVSSSQIATGKYQTYSPTTYNYYISNLSFTVGSSCTMSVPNNNTDVIVGKTSTNSTTPSITMGHIFARTGTLTMNTQTSYTISDVSWTIVGKSAVNGTAGTYNLSSSSWTATSSSLSYDTSFNGSSDLYLIPGTYCIKCTYTLTKGDWSHTFTKSADVSLAGGYVNNISGTASGGSASEIVLSVSLESWGTNNISWTLPS